MDQMTGRGRLTRAGILSLLFVFIWISGPGLGAQAVSATAPRQVMTEPETVPFTGDTINKTAPPETVQEIDLRLGGASYPGCLKQPKTPIVHYKTDDLALTDIVTITTCGWQPDEIVKVTLMDPTGKLTTTEFKAVPGKNKKSIYHVDIYYQPGVDMPEGKYRFTFTGSATVKAKVTFNKSSGAKLYALSTDPFQPLKTVQGGQNRLRLHGFLANEPVRLFAYTFEDTRIQFYGWQDFKTDGTGQLIVETDLPEISADTEMNYYAYALETHSVPLERFNQDGLNITRRFDMDLYCPGAQPPRLADAASAQPVEGIDTLAIHYQPGFGSRVTTQVPADTPLRLFGYPKCIDHAYWWQVSMRSPVLFGWVEESFLGKYLLEPVD
jgi:hypothetical protein